MLRHRRAFRSYGGDPKYFGIDLEGQQVHGTVQLLVLQGAGRTHDFAELVVLVLWERECVLKKQEHCSIAKEYIYPTPSTLLPHVLRNSTFQETRAHQFLHPKGSQLIRG
jgi:hypothetical protein